MRTFSRCSAKITVLTQVEQNIKMPKANSITGMKIRQDLRTKWAL